MDYTGNQYVIAEKVMKNQTNKVEQPLIVTNQNRLDITHNQEQKSNSPTIDNKVERTACGLIVEDSDDAEEREF